MSETVFIYALKEPDTGDIRYIGKSRDPEDRLRRHLSDTSATHKAHWVQDLLANGYAPIIEILDEVPVEHWQQWEVAWIEFAKEQGFSLVNGTPGGEGTEATPEIRKKLSKANRGKKRTAETCLKISLAKKGTRHTQEWKENHSKKMMGPNNPRFGLPSPMRGKPGAMGGKRHSIEAKEKISKSNRGSNNPMFGIPSPMLDKKHSLDTRKKQSEARRAYWASKKKL